MSYKEILKEFPLFFKGLLTKKLDCANILYAKKLANSNIVQRIGEKMTLNDANLGQEYIIKDVNTDGDEEMESFLFSLGCYSGEAITVVDKQRNLVVSIKDARYNIDPELAGAIEI